MNIRRSLSKLVLFMLANEHKHTGVQKFSKLYGTTSKFYMPCC